MKVRIALRILITAGKSDSIKYEIKEAKPLNTLCRLSAPIA